MDSNVKTSLIAVGQFVLLFVLLLVALFLFVLLHGISPMFLGALFIVGGIGIVNFGDKKINLDEGKIGKIFSYPPISQVIVKWALGLVLIWAGVCLIFKLHF